MSVNNCLHVIKLLNLQENEIIPHRFLLIKGRIEGHKRYFGTNNHHMAMDPEQLKGRVEGHKCQEPKTISLIEENCGKHQILTSADLVGTGKFKFLVDLGEENRSVLLTLHYCNVKCVLNVHYRQKVSIYAIQPLIIVAQDEIVAEEKELKMSIYQQIVDLNLLLIQSVYAEKLRERSQGRLCFSFNGKCQIFQSSLCKEEIWQMSEHDLWSNFGKELLMSEEWGQENHLKFVAFIACSRYLGEQVAETKDYSYANIRKHIQGHAALGTGGLALFSSTYFYTWPQEFSNILKCFEDKQKLDLSKEPDDSNYRKTRGGVYASSLGAVCHEIGHIFDSGHDLEGVMGSNFDYINHVFVVNNLTEHLPQRILQKQPQQQMGKPRFTQLKKIPAQGFLDCYREQKDNDSFFFSPNSAIILAHHPWLREETDIIDNNDFEVDFCHDLFEIKSKKYALKLIEVRTNSNSLVTEWFEFQRQHQEEPVFQFNLSKFQNQLKNDSSYIFVMSIKGHTKKIAI